MGSERRIFTGDECSRSSKVVDFGTNRKGVCNFLIVVNSNFGPILHRFWDTASYWLKIAYFLPHFHLTPSLRVNPVEFLDDLFIQKTRVLGLSVGEDFMILTFTQCQHVTDRQTDGQMNRQITGQTSWRWLVQGLHMLKPCKNRHSDESNDTNINWLYLQ